ncbi:ribosomal protein S18-alanine N-acetyltransferase [Lactiplantibacillus sp. WILCCON 0030]|uniref:[Ribosomal protein bS18]-alanine N-acetyltransferase n=1 Tax=Lactiplantibacillus brownii TaxID=3069269 RepID=A0ABU1A6Q2_9LACO|nr:ribosomal protein S18-alanine N-acetyltransferase [Lactiplantibacillus brownii]MDQ7936556.1 ribosomal protein S18-alanine N-acetyltransferase [Lactiplantibacillus brownii]
MLKPELVASPAWSTEWVAQACYDLAAAAYPGGAPWRLATFAADLALPQSRYQLLVLRQRPIGFISLTTVLDETEVTNVAVHPDYQRHGYARQMLETVFAQLTAADKLFLEVRTSNVAARGLYEQCGFEKISVRQNYYQHPREDAIIMRKIIE